MRGLQRMVKEPLRFAVIQTRLASACEGDGRGQESVKVRLASACGGDGRGQERVRAGARGADSGEAVS